MPSTAAHSNPQSLTDAALAKAGRTLAAFGFFGLIWIDRELRVVDTFGKLANIATPGKRLDDCIVAFFGLDAEIHALKDNPDRLLELPAVAFAVTDDDAPPRKLNFTINWKPETGRFLLLVYRTGALGDLEIELSRQIRARLIAEEAVIATSRELARANADLESFASIVSHDLKAPLRHIGFLVERASESIGSANASDATTKLKEVQQLTQRLGNMLTALFDYSSLGRKVEAIEYVSTRELVQSVIESLSPDSHDVVLSGQWPNLRTVRAPLELVFRNLIANALQHHDRSDGRIEIVCSESDRYLEIRVIDDGPGLPPEVHSAVFLPFRTGRYAATGEASTGMGLALAQRAIESVGGSISLTSDPQHRRGATFIVKWPKQLKD